MKGLIVGLAMLIPSIAWGQDHWTGVGAIGRTAMYMDTTTIVRVGSLRKVWIKSIDPTPTTVVIGTDTVIFDAVAGLNVLDCSHQTYSVQSVRYYYGGETTFSKPEINAAPQPILPRTFLAAVYTDMCRHH